MQIEMPKSKKTIEILGTQWTIFPRVRKLTVNGAHVNGACDETKRTIEIDSVLTGDFALHILVHEILHCVEYSLGLQFDHAQLDQLAAFVVTHRALISSKKDFEAKERTAIMEVYFEDRDDGKMYARDRAREKPESTAHVVERRLDPKSKSIAVLSALIDSWHRDSHYHADNAVDTMPPAVRRAIAIAIVCGLGR